MKEEKYCQSCSMPLTEDVSGTEKDGSASHVYCKYCYQDGQFTHPHLTLEKMIEHMMKRMDKENFPEEIVEAAISRLPNLKRWRESKLIIVFGLPGTGKTYFAKRLCDRINATYLGSDRVRHNLSMRNKFTRENKNVVYDLLLSKALKHIHENETVVLDATFYKNNLRLRFNNYFNSDHRIYYIEITADEDLIRRRLEQRTDENEADFAVYKQIKSEWENAIFPHLTLESRDDNIEDMLEKATAYIEAKPAIAQD